MLWLNLLLLLWLYLEYYAVRSMALLTMAILTAAPWPPCTCAYYGSTHYCPQFAATKAVLQQRPRAYYERLLLWLITPHDSMHTKGALPSYHPARLITPHDSMHTKGDLAPSNPGPDPSPDPTPTPTPTPSPDPNPGPDPNSSPHPGH